MPKGISPKLAPKDERPDPAEAGQGKRDWIPGREEGMAKAQGRKERLREVHAGRSGRRSGDRGKRCRPLLTIMGPECHALGCFPTGNGSS